MLPRCNAVSIGGILIICNHATTGCIAFASIAADAVAAGAAVRWIVITVDVTVGTIVVAAVAAAIVVNRAILSHAAAAAVAAASAVARAFGVFHN